MSEPKPVVYYDPMEGLPGKGPIPSEFMVVGMAPSPSRPRHRRLEPFGANSYRVIQAIQSRVPGDVYYTNLVKEPLKSGRKLGVKRIRRWLPVLMREIALVKPRRILVLGAEPAVHLCPGFTRLDDSHGIFFVNPQIPGAWLVPTFHFSSLYYNPAYRRNLERDLQRFFCLPDPEYAVYNMFDDPTALPFDGHETIVIDIETEGLERYDRVLQIGLESEKHGIWIIRRPTQAQVIQLGHVVRDRRLTLIGHNSPFDLGVLLTASGTRFPRCAWHDTMLMAHVAGQQTVNLKHLGVMFTDYPGFKSPERFDDPVYLAEDCRMTRAVYNRFQKTSGQTFIYDRVLRPMVSLVASMREGGVYVDVNRLEEIREKVRGTVQELQEGLLQTLGQEDLNLNAPVQLAAALLRQGVPLREKTPGGFYSVAESVLLPLAEDYPVCQQVLDYREQSKLESGFIKPYLDFVTAGHPYLHPRLLLHGALTGRLSCRDPNLQQVPRKGPIKDIFISRWPGGGMALVDLSQAELRGAAFVSGDEELAAALKAADVHRVLGALYFAKGEEELTEAERKKGKTITFGLLYGGSTLGLAKRANLPEDRVMEGLNRFFNRYKKLARFLRGTREGLSSKPYVESPFGRIRDLSDLIEQEGEKSAYRKAVNTPIQGMASDIVLWIAVQTDRELRRRNMRSRLRWGVHDSLIAEYFPGEEDALRDVVQQAFQSLEETPLGDFDLFYDLPIIGELKLGPSWAHIEETNDNYGPTQTFECSSLPA